MPRPNYSSQIVAIGIFLFLPLKAFADIGLMEYDTIGTTDILTDNAGHAGVYLSNICMAAGVNQPGQTNQFRVCTADDKARGITGTVVQRYANLSGRNKQQLKKDPNADWIALPINMNLYGTTAGKDSAPIIAAPKIADQLRSDAFHNDNSTLHIQSITDPGTAQSADAQKIQAKDKAQVPLAQGDWQYSIAASQIRGTHMFSLPTTTDQDQKVVDYLNNPANDISHFQQEFNNCANFANNVFKVAENGTNSDGTPKFNGRGKMEEAFLVTPSSDAKEVKAFAKKENIPYTVTVFNQTPGSFKPSSQPTDMFTESNTNIGLGQIVSHTLPSPGGTIFTILKFARKMGLPLPGFRDYLNADKELKQHGTDDIAQATFQLQQAKKAADQSASDPNSDQTKVAELKQKLQSLQNNAFGTKACWKEKRDAFKEIINSAIWAGVVDKKFEKDFNMRKEANNLLRMIPMAHINPTHEKLISDIVNTPGTTISSNADNMTITKDGVTAGLSRDNIENYDPKLGFLIMASSIVYELDSDQTTLVSDFDKDWATLMELGHKSGFTTDAMSIESVAACAAKADPKIETPLVTPSSEAASTTTCPPTASNPSI